MPVFAPLRISEEQPTHDEWRRLVGMYAGAVGRGRIDKVVLARRVGLRSPVELDVPNALRRLAASAPESTTYAYRRDGRTFLGATPERLVRTEGRTFRTVAVAGTIRRGADPAEDARARPAAARVREGPRGAPDRRRRDPRPAARRSPTRSTIAPEPGVMTLRFVQHLVTEITGTRPRGSRAARARGAPPPDARGRRRPARRRPGAHRRARGLRPWLVRGPDRLARRGRRRGAVRRAPLRDRRPDPGDAVRRLRDRRRLRPGPRVGGVADQAAGGHLRARGPGGRRMSDARLLRAFAAELVAAGVTDAVVCPGSRSTPLALALRTAPGLRVRVLLDERAGGLLRARHRPHERPAGGRCWPRRGPPSPSSTRP